MKWLKLLPQLQAVLVAQVQVRGTTINHISTNLISQVGHTHCFILTLCNRVLLCMNSFKGHS